MWNKLKPYLSKSTFTCTIVTIILLNRNNTGKYKQHRVCVCVCVCVTDDKCPNGSASKRVCARCNAGFMINMEQTKCLGV